MSFPDLVRDAPCPRFAVVLTLTCAGALGGAFQGLLSLDVYPKGDAFVWDRIEACTEVCATAGLAAGAALALVRHIAARLLLALILGALTETLRLLVRYPDLFFPSGGAASPGIDWDLIRSPLILGAPVATVMALSAHAVRTLATSISGVLASLAVSAIFGIQAFSLRDSYLLAGSLKNPWQDLLQITSFLPSLWKGGLLLGLCVAVSMYSLELLCIVLRDRGASRWSGVSVAAAGLFLFATGIGLRTWMPFTPASKVCALAFSVNGSLLVTAHEGRTLRVWSIEESDPDESPAPREVRKLRLPFKPGDHIGMAGDGSRILVASQSGRILLRKASSLDPIDEVDYADRNFHSPALSKDGRFLAVLHGADEIWLWRSGEQERPLQEPPLVLRTEGLSFIGASFSSNGCFLLAQDGEGDSMIWYAPTGDLRWQRGDLAGVSSDEELLPLFGVRPDAGNLPQMLGEEESRAFRVFTHSPHATSRDGRLTAVSLRGGVSVWGDHANTPLQIYRRLGGVIGGLDFTPDGRFIAVGNEKGQVRFLQAPSESAPHPK
jgi:hypothetical protein